MPGELTETDIKLSGHCSVEEAETLFYWLSKHPKHAVDLNDVDHLHAAALQMLMVTQNRIKSLPQDSFSAECLRQVALTSHMEIPL